MVFCENKRTQIDLNTISLSLGGTGIYHMIRDSLQEQEITV